jgi:hypothetical protein
MSSLFNKNTNRLFSVFSSIEPIKWIKTKISIVLVNFRLPWAKRY